MRKLMQTGGWMMVAAVLGGGGVKAQEPGLARDGVMVVWIHGSEGPHPASSIDRFQEAFDKYAPTRIVLVAPSVGFVKTFERTLPLGQMVENQRDVERAVAQAREVHGDLPTVYSGGSRGGFAAIYAAQRDPLAIWVAASYPCLVDDVRYPGLDGRMRRKIEEWREETHRRLAERSADNPPGVWWAGERDEVCAAASIQAMHAVAGERAELRVIPWATHTDYPRWWTPMYEMLRRRMGDER